MVQNMLSSSRIKEFRNVRDTAMEKFSNRLRAEAKANDGVVSVLKNARFAVFCILLAMCFGSGNEKRVDRSRSENRRFSSDLEPVFLKTEEESFGGSKRTS